MRTASRTVQPSGGVGEQGIDEAGFRGQLVAQRLRSAVLAGDLVQQPFELGPVLIGIEPRY